MTDLPAYLRPFVLGVLEGSDVRVDRLGELDLYRPPGTARGGAILFVHGGPGPDGLEVMPRDWPVCKGYATAAARLGVVSAVVDHSLIRGLDQLVAAADEVEAAVGVLRSDPRVDPDRVGLWFFSGAGLLAGEWLDSRPDWLRFVALTYPRLATPPGVDELVSAAEVIGKHDRGGGAGKVSSKDLPVLLTKAGLESEELADPVAEFVSAGGAALDIIDVPKGHHGFDMLDHTEESRAAVTKALDWAIAHLGEEPGDEGKLLVPPPPAKKKTTTTTRRTPAAARTAVAERPAAPAEPATRPAPSATPSATRTATPSVAPAAVPVAAPEPVAPVVVPAPAQPTLGDLGLATVAAVSTETPAARIVAREHAAYAAHDLEAFLATYSPTARIQRADGSELKGRRFLREYHRPRFEAGRCKTEIVERLMLGEWVVEHVISHDDGEAVPQLALYRVVDGQITDVEFRA
ncbi:nuclear transport factor 2 family protein [Kribbella solani]|uniref:nuclear transport factor 2 family protein n=1 Tax=Kribbella solani TaxID=236067 RepID=UPI0029AF077F|nr:nuclear transport factor 2 family protein [Kribbella solani]MDX2968312.1 nuclear transport factor 2 family protein [Kribbella solani]